MNPASQNTPFGRLAKGPANGSQPAHSGRSARPHPHSLDHPRTEPVGAGMDPARQRRPAAVPARTAGRPALRHLGLPPRGPSHRRGHHLRRRPGDRNLQPVRRRASGRAAVAQRPAGGCRTPAGPAHRRLRARYRPGSCPASRLPGPRPAPRLGARSCTMTAFPDQPSCRTPKASATAGRFTEAMVGSAAKSQPQSLNVFGMLAAGFLPADYFRARVPGRRCLHCMQICPLCTCLNWLLMTCAGRSRL